MKKIKSYMESVVSMFKAYGFIQTIYLLYFGECKWSDLVFPTKEHTGTYSQYIRYLNRHNCQVTWY